MMTVAPAKIPLRDRRRAAVERIALDLALEHGYDAVTVEMICDAALISPSTFFNYFGSKDRAVLGPEPQPFDEHRLAAFATGHGDVLTELMLLIVADWPEAPADRELILARLDLTERTPALHAAHIARLDRASDQVERAAVRRLGRDGAENTAERATMLVSLSHAAMHWMIGRLRVEPAIGWPVLVGRAVAVLRDVTGAAD
jgi:AcrR family transcriptional regulator